MPSQHSPGIESSFSPDCALKNVGAVRFAQDWPAAPVNDQGMKFSPAVLLLAATFCLGAWAQTPRVYRERIEPHWFAENGRFWYRNDLRDGAREFVLVDAVKGERTPAFDHAQVAAALAKLTGREVAADKLPVEALEFSADGKSLLLKGLSASWRLDLESRELTDDPAARAEVESLPFDQEVRPSRRTGPETQIGT